MRLYILPISELAKAGGVGIVTALLLTGVMVTAMKFGLSPMPKPLGLAFAETVLGRTLPLPVGLSFHILYVAFWSIAYVSLFRDTLSLTNALVLGGLLWIAVLLIFFPVVGWGLLGLTVSPTLIVASLALHVLFAVFLWGLCRVVFKTSQ